MANPRDDPAAVAALREAMDALDDAGEAMRGAADVIEDGGYSEALAERLRAWALVIEGPRNDVKRIVGAADAAGARSQQEVGHGG